MNESITSSKYSSLAGMSTAISQITSNKSNADDEETINRNRNSPSFDFDNMRTNYFNAEYSVHRNDEELLADFTALLQDGEDDVFDQVNTEELRIENKKIDKVIPVPIKMEQEIRRLSNGSNRSVTDVEQLSQTIGSIMSDHDYLSRENILEIMKNDEECFFQQGNVRSKAYTESDSMVVNASETGTIESHIDDSSEMTQTDEITDFFERISKSNDSNGDLVEKLKKFEEKSRDLRKSLEKLAEANNSEVISLIQSPELSPNHSEPLEYYGNYTNSDGSEDEYMEKIKKDIDKATEINEYLQIAIKACARDISTFYKLPEDRRKKNIEEALYGFGEHLESIAKDSIEIAQTCKSYKEKNKQNENLNATQQQAAMNKPNPQKTSKQPNGSLNDTLLNQKSKERWLASSSDEDSSSEEDLSHEPIVLGLNKSTNDLSLSQINGRDDDEDNILIKNEPLLMDSEKNLPSIEDVNAKEKELSKWNDLEDNISSSGDFHGFDDADECRLNESIEIHVKTEDTSLEKNKNQASMEIGEVQMQKMTDIFDDSSEDSPVMEEDDKSIENIEKEPSSSVVQSETNKENGQSENMNNNLSQLELMENGIGTRSEDEDHTDGEFEKEDPSQDEDEDEDDREIARLTDLSSLGVKRKISSSPKTIQNKPSQTKPIAKGPTEKQRREVEFMDIMNEVDDSQENFIDSDDEKTSEIETNLREPQRRGSESKETDDIIMTEEEFLKQQNLNMKNQLLNSSSSESELDSDDSDIESLFPVQSIKKRRSKGGSLDDDDDDEDESDDSSISTKNSYESLVDKFLEKSSEKEKDKDYENKDLEAENNDDVVMAPIDMSEKDKTAVVDEEKDSTKEQPSTSSNKSKSIIASKPFKNLEKELNATFSSDESDNESKLKKSTPRKNSSNEILDTTMFKQNQKEIDSNKLSEMLANASKRKTPTVRETLDECISLSSDDDLEIEPAPVENVEQKEETTEDSDDKHKDRTVRKLLRSDQLAGETKDAQRQESDRVKRLEKKNKRLQQIIKEHREKNKAQQKDSDDVIEIVEDIILDHDSEKKQNIIVHRDILKHLKAHQVDGIKFMYDCCYGSVDTLDQHPGSGCILAHCMGLGKTLQLISLLHTVISYPQLRTTKVLVICPKSTVLNWKEEIERWLSPIKDGRRIKLYQFPDQSDIKEKINIITQWSGSDKVAGCLLLGYEAFRSLVGYHNSKKSAQTYQQKDLDKIKISVSKCLLDPGADLVICDEGHMIKNQKSTTSWAVNQIKTKRRIILTGTPIQNNLKEYYSMVNFIKPSFLGTEKEFANLYANPIKVGQHKDSSQHDITVMKQRSYVLHNQLSKFVQRREATLLKTFLPDKYEYVLFIPMTDVQNRLYEYFLEQNPVYARSGKSLISDYTVLRKIWTHPKVLENAYLNALAERKRKELAQAARANNKRNNESEDELPDDVLDSQTGKMSVTNDWWRSLVTKEDLETILPSNKLKVLFEILKQCEQNGEKCLIFSAFVAVLDVVEFFMKQVNEHREIGKPCPGLETCNSNWILGKDYYRLDGKTAKNARHQMITHFNHSDNVRARAFLISAKAGGQGINLIGANRVVLLDTSWNPSNDQQNIFRVFRLGQKKICYIYRLIAMGTMEEKVYSRSVTKQAMSCRVVDEQQIDRHYNMAELTELYTLAKPDMLNRERPNLPYDRLLADLLHNFPNMVYKYHEHDSLLESHNEKELSEDEKADAWAAYENDVKLRNQLPTHNPNFQTTSGYDSFSAYNSMYNFGSSYAPNSSMLNSYYSQMPYSADFMRMYESLFYPYSNASTSSSAANQKNLYGSVNNSLMTSPPSPLSPSSSSNSIRNLLHMNASIGSYNATNNPYMPSLPSLPPSTSTSKNYTSSMMNNNAAMQMYLNSFQSGSMSGSNTLSGTSKSTVMAPSYDSPLHSYLQQFGLLGSAPTTTSSSVSSSNSNSGTVNSVTQRNPMLSKELSMPSVTPARPPNMESLNLSANQTSVITKSTTNSNTQRNSNISNSSTMPITAATSTINSTLISTTTKPSAVTSTSSSSNANKKDNNSSGEPQISVKNINSINKSFVQPARLSIPSPVNKSAFIIDKSSTNQSKSNTSIKQSEKSKSSVPVSIVKSNANTVIPVALTRTNASTSLTTKENAQLSKESVTANFGIFYPPPTKTTTTTNTMQTTSTFNQGQKTGNTRTVTPTMNDNSNKSHSTIQKGQQTRASPVTLINSATKSSSIDPKIKRPTPSTLSLVRKTAPTSAVTVTPINPTTSSANNKTNQSSIASLNKTLNVSNSITVSSVNVPAMAASKQANRSSPITANTTSNLSKFQKTYSLTSKGTDGKAKETTWTSRNNAVTLNKITVPVSTSQQTTQLKRSESTNSVSTMNIGHTQVVTITTKPNAPSTQERYKIQNIGNSNNTVNRGNVTIRPVNTSTASSSLQTSPQIISANRTVPKNMPILTKRNPTSSTTTARIVSTNNTTATNSNQLRAVTTPRQVSVTQVTPKTVTNMNSKLATSATVNRKRKEPPTPSPTLSLSGSNSVSITPLKKARIVERNNFRAAVPQPKRISNVVGNVRVNSKPGNASSVVRTLKPTSILKTVQTPDIVEID